MTFATVRGGRPWRVQWSGQTASGRVAHSPCRGSDELHGAHSRHGRCWEQLPATGTARQEPAHC